MSDRQKKRGARDWYADGVGAYYGRRAADYANPHTDIIEPCLFRALDRWTIDLTSVLDLAAGAGEFTAGLIYASRRKVNVHACDPFTAAAYRRCTGGECEAISFEQIATGAMRGRRYTLVGCSFAMHLCPPSLLPQLTLELAQIAPQLLILTPHKRPILRDDWGFTLVSEFVHERVRTRLYASTIASDTLAAR